ncbi:MAG: protein-export chaperone SecB [Candidatus Eutrophobiaceae bacterium]
MKDTTQPKDNGRGDGAANAKSGSFAIQKIYVKDMSLEVPDSPLIFRKEWKPQAEMDIGSDAANLGNNLYEVALSVTVTTRLGDAVAYLAEAQQAGIFMLKDFPESMVDQVLSTTCASILFPFARELIGDMIVRGGFPQFIIQPINFDILYKRKLEQEATKADNVDLVGEKLPNKLGLN